MIQRLKPLNGLFKWISFKTLTKAVSVLCSSQNPDWKTSNNCLGPTVECVKLMRNILFIYFT